MVVEEVCWVFLKVIVSKSFTFAQSESIDAEMGKNFVKYQISRESAGN